MKLFIITLKDKNSGEKMRFSAIAERKELAVYSIIDKLMTAALESTADSGKLIFRKNGGPSGLGEFLAVSGDMNESASIEDIKEVSIEGDETILEF